MNYFDFYQKKRNQEKIVVLTCYDYTSARIVRDSPVDALLVGDSLAMTMHGFRDTLNATLDMMELHTAAVRRGAGSKFIITDLPFLSYRKSRRESVSAVQRLIQAGAQAVKLEGVVGNVELITHLVESGVPVMGHLGLTPQFIHILGGYKVQGRTQEAAERLKEQAQILQKAGCFALVLECVPAKLAKEITQAVNIVTIGIGAGIHTDGQVLVFQDLLGLNCDFKPKFAKRFLEGSQLFLESVTSYAQSVKQGAFPSDEHNY